MKRSAVLLPMALAMTALGGLVAPPAASANTAAVVFTCSEAGSEEVLLTYSVSVTAPAVVRKGKPIALTVSATKPAPADIPAGGIAGQMQVVLGGAGSGSVTATGLTNAVAVPIGQPMLLGPGSATATVANTGVVTFKPGTFTMSIWIGTTLTCTLPSGGPVLASTVVV
ncbi:hypothetical protein [Umezawaea sp.]|uniref:hypothetical protein n=1 Tax=Umezawaea sp. TaxID=1955258 RepID=UPI002ED50926